MLSHCYKSGICVSFLTDVHIFYRKIQKKEKIEISKNDEKSLFMTESALQKAKNDIDSCAYKRRRGISVFVEKSPLQV